MSEAAEEKKSIDIKGEPRCEPKKPQSERPYLISSQKSCKAAEDKWPDYYSLCMCESVWVTHNDPIPQPKINIHAATYDNLMPTGCLIESYG